MLLLTLSRTCIILPIAVFPELGIVRPRRLRHPRFRNDNLPLNITILVGTMTGTAEMVAQEVQTALEAAGHQASIQMMDGQNASVFSGSGPFLICTSTYGQGDVPDNAQALFNSLESERPDLSSVIYGVIALGDRTYKDTYCQGGLRFDKLLTELGARRAGDILMHDASSGTLPEEVAAQWVVPWVEQHLTNQSVSS